MKTKTKLRNKRILLVSLLGAASVCGAGLGVTVWAQTLGGTGAAMAGGAALGAAAGAGLPSAGQIPGGAGNNRQDGQNALIDEAGAAGAGAGAAAGGAQVTVQVNTTPRPLNWGPETGSDMVRQLTRTRTTRPAPSGRTTRTQARSNARLARLPASQRSRAIHSQYKKPPVGYLSWYLPEDRYKVTSKVWQYVTTPNDRFYYHPTASIMRTRHPARIIGFHTWQDAMIAGYRPDPATKPAPGQQLAHLATLTRGPMLSRYFEFVYAGQVTPEAFDANFRYTQYVARLVRGQRHTRHLVAPTVERVLGAAMGLNPLPRYVGNVPRPAQTEENAPGGEAAGAEGANAAPAGNGDRRGEEYDQFRNNAGGLARQPDQ